MDHSKSASSRMCARCGRPLSRYNDGDYCGGCAKADSRDRVGLADSAGVAEIGARLRAARLRRGMTQEVLAGLAGLSSAYVSMVENGQRRLDRYSLIIALADTLGVPPGELAPGMAVRRNQLAARRKAVGYSQEQLAESLRIDRSTVGRWESGETEPQPWLRPRLAKALQVSVDQLNDLLAEAFPEPNRETNSVALRVPVGARIAELRCERNLTQESLAELAGLSAVTVAKLEQQTRNPSLATLHIVAHALGVPPGALIDHSRQVDAGGIDVSGARSARAEQARLSRAMRDAGHSWRQVADEFARRWGVTYLQAFRLVHGLSQEQAAERFNARCTPERPLSGKNISYWEMWPSPTGKQPPLAKLKKLAEVYECSLSDLLAERDTDKSGHSTGSDRETLRRDVLKLGLLATVSPEIVHHLLCGAASAERPDPSPAITELCAMLMDYRFNLGRFASTENGQLRSPRDLEHDVSVAFKAYQQGRFTSAASRTSMLLADTQLVARECKQAERAQVQKVLALSYQAAASILTKVGESDLALIAAERGLNAAESADDPSVRASLIRSVAFTLHSTGRYEPAMRLVESGVDYLDSETSGSDLTSLSVHGTLLLVGSMAAARFGDSSRVADYLTEATRAARCLGEDANHLWTAFGPTNVAIHRVNTAVELGNIGTVLDSGLTLNIEAVPEERRVRYLLDVARVYSMAGKREDALGTMLAAERIAPEQVHRHYVGRRVVTTLTRSATGKRTTELENLARRMKISELV